MPYRRRPGRFLTFHLERILGTTSVALEEAALKLSAEINCRALMWTLSRIDEDHELERFLSGLPGFYNSKALKDPFQHLTDKHKHQLVTRMIGFLDRTISSDVFLDYVKNRRFDICVKATDVMTPQVLSWIPHSVRTPQSDTFNFSLSTGSIATKLDI